MMYKKILIKSFCIKSRFISAILKIFFFKKFEKKIKQIFDIKFLHKKICEAVDLKLEIFPNVTLLV